MSRKEAPIGIDTKLSTLKRTSDQGLVMAGLSDITGPNNVFLAKFDSSGAV